MKLGFKIGNIKIEGLGVELGGIEINTEVSVSELKDYYQLTKVIAKESGDIMVDFINSYEKASKHQDKVNYKNYIEEQERKRNDRREFEEKMKRMQKRFEETAREIEAEVEEF